MLSLQKITRVAETSRTSKARDNPSMELGKCREQKGVYPGSTKRQQESPLCHIDGHVSSQKFGIATKITEVQWQNCVLGDIIKDDSGAYAVFTEQGLSASQMTATKSMDVIVRLPCCHGQAADVRSAHTQVKIGGSSHIAQNSQIRMSRR